MCYLTALNINNVTKYGFKRSLSGAHVTPCRFFVSGNVMKIVTNVQEDHTQSVIVQMKHTF